VEEVWVGQVAGIRLTTSAPVHAYLRHTQVEPVKTLHPKEKRGTLWYWDNKMCFVRWEECEQDEPGDTLAHTFSCPIFPTCTPVWYYFRGEAGGAPTPSNTAIFRSHLTWPTPPTCNMPAPSFTLIAVAGISKQAPLANPTKAAS
jgi:hypothetical protein